MTNPKTKPALAVVDAAASNKAINAKIKQVKTLRVKRNDLIQQVIIDVAIHATTVGNYDITGYNRLLNDGMATVDRRALVMNYIQERFPVTFANKNGFLSASIIKNGPDATKSWSEGIDSCRALPWYETEEAQKDPEIMDIMIAGDKVLKLAESFEKKIKKGLFHDEDKARLLTLAAHLRMLAKNAVPEVLPDTMRTADITPAVEEAPVTA